MLPSPFPVRCILSVASFTELGDMVRLTWWTGEEILVIPHFSMIACSLQCLLERFWRTECCFASLQKARHGGQVRTIPRSRSVRTPVSCKAPEHISQFIVDTDCISCHNDSQAILSARHLFPLESRVLERRHRTRLIRR